MVLKFLKNWIHCIYNFSKIWRLVKKIELKYQKYGKIYKTNRDKKLCTVVKKDYYYSK